MQGVRLLVQPHLRPLPVQQPVTTSPQPAPGQEYISCHPLDEGRRIRIIALGGGRAEIETLDGPPRRRDILLGVLHPTATTATGHVRRTGYRLLDPAERSPK